MRFLLLCLVLAVSACADMSRAILESSGKGKISTNVSAFDGRAEVSLSPTFIKPANEEYWSDGSPLELGAQWTSEVPEAVVLTLVQSTMGSWGEGYAHISALDLNVDGQKVSLEPLEVFTRYDSTDLNAANCNQTGCYHTDIKSSSKKFIISLKALQAIQASEKTMLKVSYDRSYKVSDLKGLSYGNIAFIERIPDFLAAIESAKKQ